LIYGHSRRRPRGSTQPGQRRFVRRQVKSPEQRCPIYRCLTHGGLPRTAQSRAAPALSRGGIGNSWPRNTTARKPERVVVFPRSRISLRSSSEISTRKLMCPQRQQALQYRQTVFGRLNPPERRDSYICDTCSVFRYRRRAKPTASAVASGDRATLGKSDSPPPALTWRQDRSFRRDL